MIPKIVEAKYQKNYVIHFKFSDGMEGEVDFEHELDGEIFQPLRNISFFKQFQVNPELRTITWPNGADFAPEFLYEHRGEGGEP